METEWSVVWEVESRRLGYLKIPQALHLQHLVQMSFRQVEHHLLHIQLNELLFAGHELQSWTAIMMSHDASANNDYADYSKWGQF